MNLPDVKEVFLFYWWVTLTIFGFLLIFVSLTNNIIFTNAGYVFVMGLGLSLIGLGHWSSFGIKNGYYYFHFNFWRGTLAFLGACASLIGIGLIIKDIFF